ncbi:MAG: sulfite exporter TauE/SafE family protein [Proteobacteria bacterium]|nr:sulfite exporter TauE/SafE family protein [Pseudomonadota bacterium]
MRRTRVRIALACFGALASAIPCMAFAATDAAGAVPWWIWPIGLFAVSFAIGVVAVLAGVGGGVLFVPIVGGLFPFHLDFVRGAGLLLALSGALSSGPSLLRNGLASLRLAMPLALVGSTSSIVGALVGLALPTAVVQTALGVTVLAIAVLVWNTKATDIPGVRHSDPLGEALRLSGVFHDPAAGRDVDWKVHRTPAGLVAFAVIGFVGGLFGLGAGWANVPALNLLMGIPLKVSIGTSGLAISIINTSAVWIYINKGAIIPLLVVPAVVGAMVGARIGSRLLHVTHASVIRRIVIGILAAAGIRSLLQGTGIWN